MPGRFNWLPRRRSPRRQVRVDPGYAGYETTVAAVARRAPVRYAINYEEGLAALRLPEDPPRYDEVVSDWPYRYPARGNPVGPAPRYDGSEERTAERETPPTYEQARADKAGALEKELRNLSGNMRAELNAEFLLPFPGEADVSEAGGSRTVHGRSMNTVRSTRLARQGECLARYRRGLDLLHQRIDGLSPELEDSGVLDTLREMHASVAAEYRAHETAHESARRSGIPVLPLAEGDIPFERWEPETHRLKRDAVELYAEMQGELTKAFARPLPRVHGLRRQISLSRARRNELRYERAAMLEHQGELLGDYCSRIRELEARRTRAEPRLASARSFSAELDDIFAELWQLYLPFRAEHDCQLSR